MDLQGAEIEALKGAGDLLHHVKYIITEGCVKPFYKGAPTLTKLLLCWNLMVSFWSVIIWILGKPMNYKAISFSQRTCNYALVSRIMVGSWNYIFAYDWRVHYLSLAKQ